MFSERGLTFVLLCNEQMPAVNVFLALCLWDSCQTQSKRGDTTSHYFIADDQQCVPRRLKNEIQRHSSFLLFFFPPSLSISAYFFLSHVSLCMSLFILLSFRFGLLIWCISNSLTPTAHTKHIHTPSPLSV